MTLGDHLDHHAAYRPDAPALIAGPDTVTFGQLKAATDRLALGLLGLGIRPGDRVVLQTPNWVEYFYVRLACAKVGAVVVPLIFNAREHEIESVVADSGAVAYFFGREFQGFDYVELVERLRPRLPTIGHWVTIRGARVDGFGSLEEMLTDPVETRHPPAFLRSLHPGANDIDILMSTSGSTGKPKLVVRTPNIFLTLGHHIVTRARLCPDDVVLSAAPVNQGTGYSVAVVASLIAGCANVLLERFDPEETLRLIEREQITVAVGVPTHMIKLMNDPAFERYDLSSLRLFYHAGAPLGPETAAEFARRCGCNLMEAYGALDGGTPVHTLYGDPPDRVFETVGTACPGMELQIVGKDGAILGPGETGEVVYRGPNCAVGLVGTAEHSFDEEGWFYSGDLGVMDGDGYLKIVGRKKNIIIRGGQNISPDEVEAALARHPNVQQVTIVKMPDPVFGEKACAFLVPREGTAPTVRDCLTFLEDRGFAKYKAPERVEIIDELPLLPNGKVDRKYLEGEVVRRQAAVADLPE